MGQIIICSSFHKVSQYTSVTMCYVVISNPPSLSCCIMIFHSMCSFNWDAIGSWIVDRGSSQIIFVIMIESDFQHSEILFLYLRCVDCILCSDVHPGACELFYIMTNNIICFT